MTGKKRKKNLYRKSRYYREGRKKQIIISSTAGIFLLLFVFSLSHINAGKQRASRPKASAQAKTLASSEATDPKPMAKESSVSSEPVTLTVSVVGDCTLGTDEAFDYGTSLNAYYDNYGPDYFLENVRPIFEADDLTIANFEGTLTYSDNRQDKLFAFKADPEYAKILSGSFVETVNTANNHSHDYGEESFEDTLQALDAEGIVHFGYEETALVEVKGVKVGLVGIYELNDHLGRENQLRENIARVKAQGSQVTIVIFHWGNELEEEPDTNQTTLGRMAIDLGADLVCGHHPHVLQGIETYKNRSIVYSLGNFCFGGNSNPRDKDTMIFQQTFTVTGEETAADHMTKIIPCSISSEDYYNDYRPTPASGEEAQRILNKIKERSSYIN